MFCEKCGNEFINNMNPSINKRQTFIQRYFNIGNIFLFSNSESGFASSVFIDVDEVYKHVKEITNV